MQSSGYRGHHGHGHFQHGLLGGMIHHRRTHGGSHKNLFHQTSKHLS